MDGVNYSSDAVRQRRPMVHLKVTLRQAQGD